MSRSYSKSFFRRFLGVLFLFVSGTFLSQNTHAIEIAFEQDSSLPIVYINVAIKAGAAHDPIGQSGLTNFMGEMLLRGTKTRSKDLIDLQLDQMGAKLEVETRAEALIFRGAVLSSQLEHYLRLLTDILTQPFFPPNEIKKLKSEMISVIQEELGRDASLANRKFTRFLFQKHPYGNPILGSAKDIAKLTQAQISDHYKRLVQDKSIVIVGTGATSSHRISLWGKELAHFRPNTATTSVNTAIASENDTEAQSNNKLVEKVDAPTNAAHRRLLIVDKPDRTQTQINFGQIGVRMTDKSFFPLHLGNHAFGGPSFSSVMMIEVRVKRGWSYGANSNFRFGLRPRSWIAHLFPAEKDTAAALEHTLKLVSDLKEKGLTAEQFKFAKRSLINSAGFMYNTPKKRVENRLLEKTLDLPDKFMETFGEELEDVELSDVNSALKKFLLPDQMAISVLGTARNLKPALAKAAGVPMDQVEVVSYTAE